MALSWDDHMELARKFKEEQRQRNANIPKATSPPHYGNMESYESGSRLTIYIVVMVLSIFLEDCLMAWAAATLIYFMTKPKKKK